MQDWGDTNLKKKWGSEIKVFMPKFGSLGEREQQLRDGGQTHAKFPSLPEKIVRLSFLFLSLSPLANQIPPPTHPRTRATHTH